MIHQQVRCSHMKSSLSVSDHLSSEEKRERETGWEQNIVSVYQLNSCISHCLVDDIIVIDVIFLLLSSLAFLLPSPRQVEHLIFSQLISIRTWRSENNVLSQMEKVFVRCVVRKEKHVSTHIQVWLQQRIRTRWKQTIYWNMPNDDLIDNL